jgi:cell wall-associated NlpC family hydrolase
MTADSYLRNRSNFRQSLLPVLFLVVVFCTSFRGRIPYFQPPAPAPVMQLREWVAGYAQNFVGVPYRYAGGTPKSGFDCSGFTSYIFREFDLSISPCSSTQSKQGREIALSQALPGDLVFFGYRGRVTHVAMVVEQTPEGVVCVHSTSSRGVVVENVSNSKYWKSKILFARDAITSQMAEKAE